VPALYRTYHGTWNREGPSPSRALIPRGILSA